MQEFRRPWRPTKFVLKRGALRASRDAREVSPSSRLVADRIAVVYQRALNDHAGGRLLDAGCGKAPLYGVYEPLVRSVVRADRPASLHGDEHIDLYCELGAHLPLRDASFDTIVATDVIEHLPDPSLFFEEVRRLLAPNGHLILGAPFLYWLHEEPHDHYRFTSYRLERFCTERGLEVVSLEPYGGSVAVVLDIVGKHLGIGWISRIYQFFAPFVLRLFRRIDEVTKAKFPLGYLLVARAPDGGNRASVS